MTVRYGLDGQVAVVTGAANGFGLAVAQRLADEVAHQVEVVYPAHVLRYAAPAEFITQTADGFARVSDGSAQARPGTDIFGEQVREFWFETFSITLPPIPGDAS